MLTRLFVARLLAMLVLCAPVLAMAQTAPTTPDVDARSATGGAQTLEDILRRQRGETVDDEFRQSETGAGKTGAPIDQPLGAQGGASDPELWRDLRYGSADITVSSGGPVATVLIQDGGMPWHALRNGPLPTYGGYAMLGMAALLAVFYLLRGPIRIDSGRSGVTIVRFNELERFGHWLLAGSFIVLGVSGLIVLFGRIGLIDIVGKEVYATLALGSKWAHNNVAWAFMLGLALTFVMWFLRNIPNRHDLVWLLKGGGMFSRGSHPPARKFNAGQKIFFWLTMLLGASVSLSGLSLLFPFELPLFAKTFGVMNDIGLAGLFFAEPLPTQMAPHEEMQYAQLWHTIVGFAMMTVIIAHIYIGSLGMEGAYEAMGSGEVDVNWAEEHHGLWVEEERDKGRAPSKAEVRGSAPTPAE